MHKIIFFKSRVYKKYTFAYDEFNNVEHKEKCSKGGDHNWT